MTASSERAGFANPIRPETPADRIKPWRPASFAEVTPLAKAAQAGKPANTNPPADPKRELELLRQRARVEGFDAGYKAGYDTGSAAANAKASQLTALLATTQQAWHDLEHDLSEQVLALALEVARQVLRQDVRARRDALLHVVREAMQCVTEGALRPELHLHPSDLELAKSAIGDELKRGNWKLVEAHRIEPGGCRITSNHGEIDATLPTRWRRVVASLGQDVSWTDDAE